MDIEELQAGWKRHNRSVEAARRAKGEVLFECERCGVAFKGKMGVAIHQKKCRGSES